MVYTISFILSFLMCCFLDIMRKREVFSTKKKVSKREFTITIDKTKILDMNCLLGAELPVLLISSLRTGTGTDVRTYVYEFEKFLSNGINRYGADESYEMGYYLLCRLISLFSKDGQALLIVTSIVSITILFICLYKYSRSMAFSFALYILSYQYFVSFNNIRQTISMVIGMVALMKFIQNKKTIEFIFGVWLASLFHQSAIVYFFFLTINYTSLSTKMMLGISGIWFAFCKLLGKHILGFLISFLGFIPVLERLSIRLQYFLNNAIFLGKSTGNSNALIHIIIFIFILIIELQLTNEEKEEMEWKAIKYNQFFLILAYGVDGIIPIVYRITYYFVFLQIILLPNAFEKCGKNKRIMIFAVLIMEALLFAVGVIKNNDNVFPYISIFG